MMLKNWQRVVAQERHDLDTMSRRLRRDRQLAVGNEWPVTARPARSAMVCPSRSRVSSMPNSAQRSIVPVRRIFFCSSSTP